LPVELVIKILEWLPELDLEIVAQCNGSMQRVVRTVLTDRCRVRGLVLEPSASGHSIRELVDLVRPPDHQTLTQRQWTRNGQLDRSGVPAQIWYYQNGQKVYEYWYRGGKKHRIEGPAMINYYANGQENYEYWYHDGLLHRVEGPAAISYYQNGQKQRETWYHEDKRHRIEGPAEISYYQDGQIRRMVP
jgi:hypothetical protein